MAWKPGQHCFLRFTSFGLHALSSHPFTICSLPASQPKGRSDLVFYIRHQRGLTEKLYNYALERPEESVPVLIDGPYGGINMQRYLEADRLLVVAGGSGAGWVLPFIELFQRRSSKPAGDDYGRVFDTREEKPPPSKDHRCERNVFEHVSLRVILATRDTSSRAWFLQTVSELLSRYPAPNSESDIHIEVYLTGEGDRELNSLKSAEIGAASASPAENNDSSVDADHANVLFKAFRSRPELPLIIYEEGVRTEKANHLLSVFVCGPSSLQNDVRNAVAKENLGILKGSAPRGVYLHSEHFSWA